MPDSLLVTRLLNAWFGGITASAMHALGIQANPAAVFNDTFSLELMVVCGLIVFFLLVRVSLSVENPNAMQQVAEMIHGFTRSQGEEVIGHRHGEFQAFNTCVLLFVLLNNCLGLIPRTITPTSQPVVPLGIAALAFLYYNFHGLREQGPVGYVKHFAGPIWWLSPLLFPIEIISHLARVMSLTIRLFANMLASDLLTLVIFSMIPLAIPVVPLLLHLGVSLVQAFVFMLLSMIYLSLAVAHEH